MPLGIVTDEEFEVEQKDSSVEFRPIPTPGRNKGDNNVPESLRKIIGETSEIDGPKEAIELANQFGISRSSVSAYANGSRSTKTYDDQPLLEHINKAKTKITKRALTKMRQAMSHITNEKLEAAKPDVLSAVARNMSAIVKDMEPESPRNPGDKEKPQFVFFSPTFIKEDHFENVFVKE